jgi:hypothetical protein
MLTETEIAELKAKNPGATLAEIKNEAVLGDEVFVVKVPQDAAWKLFQTQRANDEQAPYALRTLVLGHMVKPTPQEFLLRLNEMPGLVETVGGQLVKLAGASNASTVRKL